MKASQSSQGLWWGASLGQARGRRSSCSGRIAPNCDELFRLWLKETRLVWKISRGEGEGEGRGGRDLQRVLLVGCEKRK